jgi:hypothetical protein
MFRDEHEKEIEEGGDLMVVIFSIKSNKKKHLLNHRVVNF